MVPLVKNPAQLMERIKQLHCIQTDSPDIAMLKACDVVPSVSQTEVWLTCPDNGRVPVAQAKLSMHEISIRDYPAMRRNGMRGGEASRLARRWGHELPPDHPAYRQVHALATALGTSPRKGFVVIEVDAATIVSSSANGASVSSLAPKAPRGAEDAIVDAIGKLVPLLGPSSLMQVREMIAE